MSHFALMSCPRYTVEVEWKPSGTRCGVAARPNRRSRNKPPILPEYRQLGSSRPGSMDRDSYLQCDIVSARLHGVASEEGVCTCMGMQAAGLTGGR